MNATVFVVDDDAAVRDGISLLLETAGLAVTACASAEAFLAAYRPGEPGCLVLDVRMPGMSGPELQAELARRGIDLPIVFLTAHGDIPTTVKTIKAGAVDFLTKPVEGALLLERVQAALAQERDNHRHATASQAAAQRLAGLTAREREVMALAVAGHSNKEIARRLGISHRTVEIHRVRVMRKMGAANLIELARLAEACGLPAAPEA